ncbi:hypothetical protein C8J57DRAFT_1719135 [Mycena rebaudengoi]|nr:hypothetical protein C8J57DRAFT_1719135 [Mycena rebaudengoi]
MSSTVVKKEQSYPEEGRCLYAMCTHAEPNVGCIVDPIDSIALKEVPQRRQYVCKSPFRYVPQVPQEIIDMIVDNVEDISSFKACSLVCWAFVPISRTHIFHTVSLDMLNNAPHKLYTMLMRSPYIALYVRDLTIYRASDTDLWMEQGSPLPAVLAILEHVTRFSIFGCWGDWANVPPAPRSSNPAHGLPPPPRPPPHPHSRQRPSRPPPMRPRSTRLLPLPRRPRPPRGSTRHARSPRHRRPHVHQPLARPQGRPHPRADPRRRRRRRAARVRQRAPRRAQPHPQQPAQLGAAPAHARRHRVHPRAPRRPDPRATLRTHRHRAPHRPAHLPPPPHHGDHRRRPPRLPPTRPRAPPRTQPPTRAPPPRTTAPARRRRARPQRTGPRAPAARDGRRSGASHRQPQRQPHPRQRRQQHAARNALPRAPHAPHHARARGLAPEPRARLRPVLPRAPPARESPRRAHRGAGVAGARGGGDAAAAVYERVAASEQGEVNVNVNRRKGGRRWRPLRFFSIFSGIFLWTTRTLVLFIYLYSPSVPPLLSHSLTHPLSAHPPLPCCTCTPTHA